MTPGNREELYALKKQHMTQLYEYRRELRLKPQLRRLFFELTMRCNENCLHCGSRCGEDTAPPELPAGEFIRLIDQVARDFPRKPMLCITGGEPLLRREFFQIMEHARDMGFSWGMTSNGTLITKDAARRLEQAGMKTISISLDGLRDTHDAFRRTPGGFDRAVTGIRNLLERSFSAVQITTVVTRKSLPQLPRLFDFVRDLDVDQWRVINIEPIGRALDLEGYLLQPGEYRRMFEFIRQKRREGYPVMYGCSHYLGLDFEREVRDWYFLCNAGVYTASIMANGDIAACLDIERRAETIQGNILTDDFTQVWNERFGIFRRPLSDLNEECRTCGSRDFCEGGAHHSWDYDRNEPMVCFKDILFRG